MNYLAHAFLSGVEPEFLLGNVSADLLKGNKPNDFPEMMAAGVLHHRKIDVFTDNHPIFRSCLTALYPQHGKYASVVLDILFDYYLVKYWQLFNDTPLDVFCEKTNALLLAGVSLLPVKVEVQLTSMIQGNWLYHYGHHEGLSYCFMRLTKRVAQPERLSNWRETLDKHEEYLASAFLRFFPELIEYSKKETSLQNVRK
jgi:acyl carrier protein phosphodiesterase